jgi:hypothetical protein
MELLPATSSSVLRHLNALGYQDVSSDIVQGFVKELNEMMGEDTLSMTLWETKQHGRTNDDYQQDATQSQQQDKERIENYTNHSDRDQHTYTPHTRLTQSSIEPITNESETLSIHRQKRSQQEYSTQKHPDHASQSHQRHIIPRASSHHRHQQHQQQKDWASQRTQSHNRNYIAQESPLQKVHQNPHRLNSETYVQRYPEALNPNRSSIRSPGDIEATQLHAHNQRRTQYSEFDNSAFESRTALSHTEDLRQTYLIDESQVKKQLVELGYDISTIPQSVIKEFVQELQEMLYGLPDDTAARNPSPSWTGIETGTRDPLAV